MRYKIVIGLLVALLMCASASAEEKKAQGMDMVTDTASAVVNKGLALLSGDLKVTVKLDNDRIKNKNNYTTNALGERVPKSTVQKSAAPSGQGTASTSGEILKATL